MDTARLVLDYLEVLVWPTVVIVLVVLFRQRIAGLIDRLSKLSAGGVDVEFSTQVVAVSASAYQSAPELPSSEVARGPTTGEVTGSLHDLMAALIEVNTGRAPSPERALLNAWNSLSDAIGTAYIQVVGGDTRQSRRTSFATQLQGLSVIIPEDVRASIMNLKRLRDEVVHDTTHLSEVAAVSYVAACDRLVRFINQQAADYTPPP